VKAEISLQDFERQLPPLDKPPGNFIHAVRTGNLLFLAGKGPNVSGKVGESVSLEDARQLARQVDLMLLAAIKFEVGSLDRVNRVVKVLGFVNATSEFRHHPQVIDGCSDLFVEVFGEAGRHARSAVGVGSLPFGIPVEIEAVVEVRE
jgi:enamine deaminase RidA (YjgF/YER057c/UK114 family)